jgi:predicted porin
MKRSLLALAALTAFAGVASAQSSVTVFGVVDLNARNVKNGSLNDVNSLSTDGNASSRLGFRGVEDLGGGLRAGFWLEAGMDASNGTIGGGNGGATANAVAGTANGSTSGAMFNRRATASLLGGFGEIRVGRDYTPTFWNHTIFDVFGTNGVASATNLMAVNPSVAVFGNTQTLVRANNSIGYFLPSLGGVYGQAMITANENQNLGNKYTAGRIGYAGGPVNVALGFGQTKKTSTMPADMKVAQVGGSFNLGFMNIVGQYNQYKQSPLTLTNYSLGVAVPIGAGTIKASFGNTELKTATVKPKATQLGLGYVYDLSKRTALYGHYAEIDNDAGLAYVVGAGSPAPASGFKSKGYEVGIRHSF